MFKYNSMFCKHLAGYRRAMHGFADMEKQIQDKVLVVTGGGQGLGLTMADNFLRCGARSVFLLDLNETVGNKAAEDLRCKYGFDKACFMKCNVTKDLEAVSCAILQWTSVDILLNNAGIIDEASPRRTIEINTIAVLEWGMKFWEHMRKDKGGNGGTIFNVASIYGFVRDPWLVHYKASKHGVMGFTKTLGHEYNYCKTGVRVIAICPGFTATNMTSAITPFEYQKEDFKEFAKKQTFQTMETVGKAAIEIFQVADSGQCWVAKDNKPIELAPNA